MVLLEAAALYAGLNILILLALAIPVPFQRRAAKVSLGDGDNPRLRRAVRAHANAAEYAPAGIAGIVLLALFDPATPLWLLHAAGASLTAGRVLHGIGLSLGEINAGRMLGTLLTWVSYALIGGGLLYVGLVARI